MKRREFITLRRGGSKLGRVLTNPQIAALASPESLTISSLNK